MAKAPTITADEELVAGAASPAEAKVFHDIVENLGRLPDGVKRVRFRYGEDSDGAPATWVIITVSDDLSPSPDKVASISRVAKQIQNELLRSDTARWPYVEIVTG
jgi:hypothetical protein